MEKNSRICKICNRRFSNGKAMGGHMRSHLAKLPIPPKPQQQQLIRPKSPTPSSSYSSSLHNFSKTNTEVHDELQTRFMASSNREVLSQDSTILYDKVDSTEIDSNQNNITRRRSERRRKAIGRATLIETDQVSSILSNETFSQVEEVARCLIMLSRDKWDKGNDNVFRNKLIVNQDHDDDYDEEEEEYELLSNSKSRIRVRTNKSNKCYKCETCNKMFKSYQALGGHKASHKKITNQSFESESDLQEEKEGGSSFVVERRRFECPFCFKVFGSGQALGGHKKVHSSNVTINNISSATKFKDHNLIIDLNLPAPEEELSQIGFSTVSD